VIKVAVLTTKPFGDLPKAKEHRVAVGRFVENAPLKPRHKERRYTLSLVVGGRKILVVKNPEAMQGVIDLFREEL
jgi:hypothetical protein